MIGNSLAQRTLPLAKSFDMLLAEGQYGGSSGDEIVRDIQQEMFRAFATSPITLPNGSVTGDGTNLQLLNLDATMVSVLLDETSLKLWNWLSRIPSPNGLYQWNRRTRFGSSRGMAGFAEGGAPAGSTGAYLRDFANVMFMGERRGVTHQFQLMGNMQGYQLDPVAEERRNGTINLLQKIERWFMFGDSLIRDVNGNIVNYDGLLKQVATKFPSHIIDKKGQPLTFEDMEEVGLELNTVGLLTNFNQVKCFMSPHILSDLSKLKLQAEYKRLGTDNPEGGYTPGVPMKGYDSNFGFLGFEPTLYFNAVEGNRGLAVADPNAPAAPGVVTLAAANDPLSVLDTSHNYYYRAGAFNDSGESAISTVSAVQATAGTPVQAITATIPRVTPCLGYNLYRGDAADGSDAQWIARIPQPASGNATYLDRNAVRPGTGMMAVLERNPENLVVAQVAPLIQFPLAVQNTTVEFLLLLYHVLALKAGERQIIYRNVGRLT